MNVRVAFSVSGNVRVINKPVYHYTNNEAGVCNTFVPDLEYFTEWYSCFFNSIPQNKVNGLMKECVLLRLKYRSYLQEYYIRKNVWRKVAYHKTLEADIKSCGYKLKMTDRISLFCHNPITCFVFMSLVGMLDWLKKFIS